MKKKILIVLLAIIILLGAGLVVGYFYVVEKAKDMSFGDARTMMKDEEVRVINYAKNDFSEFNVDGKKVGFRTYYYVDGFLDRENSESFAFGWVVEEVYKESDGTFITEYNEPMVYECSLDICGGMLLNDSNRSIFKDDKYLYFENWPEDVLNDRFFTDEEYKAQEIEKLREKIKEKVEAYEGE